MLGGVIGHGMDGRFSRVFGVVGIVVALLLGGVALSTGSAQAAGDLFPAAVSATFDTAGLIVVVWTPVLGASSYTVGWTETDGPDQFPTRTASAPSTSNVLSLSPGTSLCESRGCRVWVQAVVGGSTGRWSPVAYVVGKTASAPTNVGLSWVGTSAVATWAAPADLGSPAMTVYSVEVTYASNTGWKTYEYGAPSTTTSANLTTIGGLFTPFGCDNLGCSVRVFAVSPSGVKSAASARVVLGPRAPSVPTNVAVSWVGSSAVATWVAPVDLGAPAMGYYLVEVTHFDRGVWKSDTFYVDPASTSVNIRTWETPGVPFYCESAGCSVRVFAVTASGVMSAPSGRVYIGPHAPSAPTNVTWSRVNGDVVATWAPPTDLGTPVVSSYSVEVTFMYNGTWRTYVTGVGDSTSFNVSSSLNGWGWSTCDVMGCSIRVFAVGGVMGAASARVVIGSRAPSAPTNVTWSRVGADAVVTWAPPVDLGAPVLNGYYVEVTFMYNSAWRTSLNYLGDTTSFNLSSFMTGSWSSSCEVMGCSIRVFSANSGGTGAASARVVIGATPVASVAGSPGGFLATRSANDQVNLTWSIPTIGSPATSYPLCHNGGCR